MTGEPRIRFKSISLFLPLLLIVCIAVIAVMAIYQTRQRSGVAQALSAVENKLPQRDFNASVTTSDGNVIVTNHDDYDYYNSRISFITAKLSGGDYPERETHYCYFVDGITIPAHSKVTVSLGQFRNSYGMKPDWSQELPNVFMIKADNEKLSGSYSSAMK